MTKDVETTEQETQSLELRAADVIVTLKKAGKVSLEDLANMTNDPEAKVLRVTHVNKKIKLDWEHPVRKVEFLDPVLDDKGQHQRDQDKHLMYTVRVEDVEDTDPQNIEVRIADGEGEA